MINCSLIAPPSPVLPASLLTHNNSSQKNCSSLCWDGFLFFLFYNMNKISVLTFLPDLARLCYCNQFLIKLMFAPASHQPVQECPHTTIIRLWNSLDNFPRIQCLLAAEHNLYNSCYYLARYHITSHHITSHHITSHTLYVSPRLDTWQNV